MTDTDTPVEAPTQGELNREDARQWLARDCHQGLRALHDFREAGDALHDLSLSTSSATSRAQ